MLRYKNVNQKDIAVLDEVQSITLEVLFKLVETNKTAENIKT